MVQRVAEAPLLHDIIKLYNLKKINQLMRLTSSLPLWTGEKYKKNIFFVSENYDLNWGQGGGKKGWPVGAACPHLSGKNVQKRFFDLDSERAPSISFIHINWAHRIKKRLLALSATNIVSAAR